MNRFCTIASSSSGNCTYVEAAGQHFLIDMGISCKRLDKALIALDVPHIDGIFITHEHSDHIKGVGTAARRYKAPVYAAPLVWRYFLRHGTLGPIPEAQVRVIEPEQTLTLNDAQITAFDIPHDAIQPVGYTFVADGVKMGVATDLGNATATVCTHLRGARTMLLESNHDVEMLRNGKYPASLKMRVAGNRGHLSNPAAGALLAEIAWEGLESVVLGHLSEHNNMPLLAYDAVQRVLDANQIAIKLYVAGRNELGELINW